MKRLLLVSHAPSPNTQRLREALLRGAQHPDVAAGVEVVDRAALEATADDILACDAIVLLMTENLASMSGGMKDFFDRNYYPVLEEKQGLPCSVVIRAGHDGTGTRRQLDTILTGLRWKYVQEPLLLRGEWRDTFLAQAEELGLTIAASLDAGIL